MPTQSALDFDGSATVLNGGDLTFLDGLTKISCCFWAHLDDATPAADNYFISKNATNFASGLSVFLDASGPNANDVFEVFERQGGTTTRLASATTDGLSDNTWYLFSFTLNYGSSGGLRAAINGVEVEGAGGSLAGKTSFPNNANDFILGTHNDGSKDLDGGMYGLTWWDEIVPVEDFLAMYNSGSGLPPESVHPRGIIRKWALDGNNLTTEPDLYGSGDGLTVTSGSKQTSGPSVGDLDPAITGATVFNVGATTGSLHCLTDHDYGTLYAYTSQSATPPSAATLKAGTSADDHQEFDNAPLWFPFDSEPATNIAGSTDPIQSVCTDGTYYFVSSSDDIFTYNSSWSLQHTYDATGMDGGTHAQVNGMTINAAGKLIVTGNNYPQLTPVSSRESKVFTFTIESDGSLTYDSAVTLDRTAHAEFAQENDDGDYIISYNDVHVLDRYNSSWVEQANYTLPNAPTEDDDDLWQSCLLFSPDYYLCNIHGDNTDAPRTDIYYYDRDGDDFEVYKQDITPPTDKSVQGVCFDGANLLWAERVTSTQGDIEESTIIYGPSSDGKNRIDMTGLPSGVTRYTHLMHSFGDQNSTIVTVGPWNEQGSGNPHYYYTQQSVVLA